MKRLLIPLALGLALVCGCTRQYVMKLTNGAQITTPHKPALQGASYHYKDARGAEHVIPAGRVMEIAPASMAKEESRFTPSPPHKRHWYWPF